MTFQTRIAAAAMLIGLFAPSAQAGYVVTLKQAGSDIVANGSGAIDLTGLTLFFSNPLSGANLDPVGGSFETGPIGVSADLYDKIAGPASFGSCPAPFCEGVSADSGTGDLVGIFSSVALIVPGGYVSGNPLSDSSTYANRTFADLGLTPGTYEWTWGNGENQNITLIVGAGAGPGPVPTPVPEPSTLALLGFGLAGLLLAQRAPQWVRGRLPDARLV